MNRRARLRMETTREIQEIALRQLAEGGAGAISLRAIAREMEMTPRAVYTYFATRDDLITSVIGDIAVSLAETLERARDAVPPGDPGGRLLAWGQALREWALAGPQGFRLLYGDPIPGYQPPENGPVDQAARRICVGLTRLVAEASPRPAEAAGGSWSDYSPGFLAKVRPEVPDLPPATLALALRAWGRMHGLVALEIHGHIGAVSTNPAALHRAELLDLIGSLGRAPA